MSDDLEPLPIVACGDPILRRSAEPIDPSSLGGTELQRLIVRMRATMQAAPGVGLAAPQVGVPVQLAILEDNPQRWGQLSEDDRVSRERHPLPFTVLINPTWHGVDDDEVSFYEGCLSVPGLTGVVARRRVVQVHALDEHGDPLVRTFRGWPARIVQHEVDHLNGCLYLDRVETRSLSTLEAFSLHWAGRPPREAARALGFRLAQQDAV